MIGKILGRYRIFEKVGAGGMGEVYRARDERLERDVALKVLSAQALTSDTGRQRFRKEALILSKLNHPNIATILDYDTQEEIDFLVMEFIVGTTLSEKLAAGPMPQMEILPLAIQIAEALEEAHMFGVIHRDLKPNNIFVTPKGQIKVLDFGLAKLLNPISSEPVTQLTTETNLVIGTLPYMSPEQLRGEPIDTRSDIYSFGNVLYEMSTGKRPHQETQPITLADAILHKTPPPPGQISRDLSPRLQEIILKCLEKDPQNRYQSAKELALDLRRLASPSGITDTGISRVAKAGSPFHFRRLAPWAGIALLILLVALVVWNLSRKPKGVLPEEHKIDSIVALPSRVYGPEEYRFLTDAIPNALSTHLSQVKGLETKVPPTNLDIERLGGDPVRIAEVYDVNALISSSVTANADRFVLNVQLVEANSRRLLWSRDYEGLRERYLELVRSASEGLREVLRPTGLPIQHDTTETRSPDSELLFQRGFYHLRAYANRKQNEDFDRALSDLQEALDADATNARAAAALARLYVARFESGAPLREVLAEIDQWAYQALKLDHRCGEAWQVLSVSEEMRPNGDKRKRLEYALKAASYANHSGYSHHVLASALSRSSFVLSLQASQEGVRQEPLHLNGLLFRAGILSRQGKPLEGLSLIDRVLSVEPNMPVAAIMKVWVLLRDRRYRDAEEWMDRLEKMVAERRVHPGWVDFARDWLDFEKSVDGNEKQKASAALERLVSEARGQLPPFPRWELITGNVLGLQARHDSVESTLETLSLRAEKGIFEPYDWLVLSPELETVRKDNRFGDLVSLSRSEFDEMLSILDEARTRGELPSYLEKPLAQVRNLSPDKLR